MWQGGLTDTLQSPSPKAKTFGIAQAFSPGTNCQRQFLTCGSFQRRCTRQMWGGRCSTSPFYTWGFWGTDLPKVMWGVCAEPGIYYPLPKSQAGARYRQVVCRMLQPDSWKELLHSQWVPQFRIHTLVSCIGRVYMLCKQQTCAKALSALWISSPWNIIIPNCLLNLLPSRIPQSSSCGLPGGAWESSRCLSQSSLALFFV